MGHRVEVWKAGKCISVVDDRVLGDEQKEAIEQLKVKYNKVILKEVPQHDQSNIALGIISGTEAEALLAKIQAQRSEYARQKAEILNTNTLEELDVYMAGNL